MFLLDTNVVSELRKSKTGKIDKNVESWAESVVASDFFISSVSVLELETGVLQKERSDPVQGAILRSWLESSVYRTFSGRVISFDEVAAQQCAQLQVPNPRSFRDSMIAATALVHKMTVVTRNVKDFNVGGLSVVNPWHGAIN